MQILNAIDIITRGSASVRAVMSEGMDHENRFTQAFAALNRLAIENEIPLVVVRRIVRRRAFHRRRRLELPKGLGTRISKVGCSSNLAQRVRRTKRMWLRC